MLCFYLHSDAGGMVAEGCPCLTQVPAAQIQVSSLPLAIIKSIKSMAISTTADKTFFKRLNLSIYFLPPILAKSHKTPLISKINPKTKRYGVRFGRKYKTKRAMPAPLTRCESAWGLVHALIILFNHLLLDIVFQNS